MAELLDFKSSVTKPFISSYPTCAGYTWSDAHLDGFKPLVNRTVEEEQYNQPSVDTVFFLPS